MHSVPDGSCSRYVDRVCVLTVVPIADSPRSLNKFEKTRPRARHDDESSHTTIIHTSTNAQLGAEG